MAFVERNISTTVAGAKRCALASKMRSLHFVVDADIEVLLGLLVTEQQVRRGTEIFVQGSVQWSGFLVKEGMAVRHCSTPDGNLQLLSLLIPGDLCHLHGHDARPLNHSISALTDMKIALASQKEFVAACSQYPDVVATMQLCVLQEEAMLHERILSLGRRDARGRIAQLLCELYWRYEAIGHIGREPFEVLLTQTDLADLLGLTSVTVNRVLRSLREDHLVENANRRLIVLDVTGLQAVAAISKEYLGLQGDVLQPWRQGLPDAHGSRFAAN